VTVDRARLRALAEKATPGPWGLVEGSRGGWVAGDNGALLIDVAGSTNYRADLEYLESVSPGVVLHLLDAADERDRLQERVERLEAALGKIADRAALRRSSEPTPDYAALIHIEHIARDALTGGWS
jgi:hypothetical protein